MALVLAEVQEVDLEGDYGDVPGIKATCLRCKHTTESFGDSEASVRRCLVLLRQECPLEMDNYYKQKK